MTACFTIAFPRGLRHRFHRTLLLAKVGQQGRPLLGRHKGALAALDLRKGRVIELRFFSGLSLEETAEVLGVSGKTVMRDWEFAKAWLQREMARGRHGA